MKAFLMYRTKDFDLEGPLSEQQGALVQDLELDVLWNAMARGDQFLREVVSHAMLSSVSDADAIRYRQDVLADCLEHPMVVRRLYEVTVEAFEAQRKVWRAFMSTSPDSVLGSSIRVLEILLPFLRELRALADEHAGAFRSEGFARFFAMLSAELADAYFTTVEEHLGELKFRQGVLMTGRLGRGNKGRNYVLRRTPRRHWLARARRRRSVLSFQIADRDEAGARALSDLRGRGVNLLANAVAQAADHILDFLKMLRTELAFHIGCLNLSERLAEPELGEPTCLPVPAAPGQSRLSARELYEPCLALTLGGRVVGNDVEADGKRLVMVTGANQGGKSTFLRSAGLAHLMMQSGMFVAAESFRADVREGIFTHFKREEDSTMTSGKLDEELARMSEITERIRPLSLLLCNESFASTNEREGSEIARQVVRALIEAGVKVLFVTHLFDLAHGLFAQRDEQALFLRAERHTGGIRSFRLLEGEPLPTSFGQDSYRRIFGAPRERAVPETQATASGA